jgi:hypothetical protein
VVIIIVVIIIISFNVSNTINNHLTKFDFIL